MRPDGQGGTKEEKPRTTAELLVGDWEWVKTKDDPVSGIVKERVTFGADGQFRFTMTDPFHGKRISAGTYRLVFRSSGCGRRSRPYGEV